MGHTLPLLKLRYLIQKHIWVTLLFAGGKLRVKEYNFFNCKEAISFQVNQFILYRKSSLTTMFYVTFNQNSVLLGAVVFKVDKNYTQKEKQTKRGD